MKWAGKIIGGTFGFLIGGPIGAIIGALGGNYFDEISEEKISQQERLDLVFFTTIFSMFAKIAKADGIVQKEEVIVIDNIIKNIFKFDNETRKLAISIFNEAKKSHYSIEEFAYQFKDFFKNKPALLDEMFFMLFDIAAADGKLTKDEERELKKVQRIFEIPDYTYESYKMRYNFREDKAQESELKRALKILGLNGNESKEDIKKRYRELVKQYHPDNIISKGLPQEFIELAEKKFNEIKWAYDYVLSIKIKQ